MGEDRQLSDAERRLWRKVMGDLISDVSNEHDAPENFEALLNESSASALQKDPPAPDRGSLKPLPPGASSPSFVPSTGASFGGIDRRTDDRLRRGKLNIDARIDLHGMTQDAAFSNLNMFISQCYDQGKRVVLVITGKGKAHEGSGVLRRRLPDWLRGASLSDKVLTFHTARPQHGGEGAVYVLLRKKRLRP